MNRESLLRLLAVFSAITGLVLLFTPGAKGMVGLSGISLYSVGVLLGGIFAGLGTRVRVRSMRALAGETQEAGGSFRVAVRHALRTTSWTGLGLIVLGSRLMPADFFGLFGAPLLVAGFLACAIGVVGPPNPQPRHPALVAVGVLLFVLGWLVVAGTATETAQFVIHLRRRDLTGLVLWWVAAPLILAMGYGLRFGLSRRQRQARIVVAAGLFVVVAGLALATR